jgi:hypothetical protein
MQQNATARAIENATSSARFIAKQIGAHIGEVLAINDVGPAIGIQGVCTTSYGLGPYGPPAPQMADMLTVKVYAGVNMRFAIRR